MSYLILPDDEAFFSKGRIDRDLNSFLDNGEIDIQYSPKNKYFLFQLGMILAYNHYSSAARMPKKEYRLIELIEPTHGKSYGNVILHFIENGTEQLPRYDRYDDRAFIISSVRNANEEDILRGRQEKKKLGDKGIRGHFPYDDTPQDDSIGKDIVKYNINKEAESGIEALLYNPESTGSVVDLGSFFMLKYVLDATMGYKYVPIGRQLLLLNKDEMLQGCFENLIGELAENNH